MQRPETRSPTTAARWSRRPVEARTRFADETPQQIAQHREIARRHRRRHNNGASVLRLRIAELERIFALRYRERCLPDDDAGHADLRLVADHLAQIDPSLIRFWAEAWMPTLPATEIGKLIADIGPGRRWKADALARELGLDDAARTRLKIRTIGAIDYGKAKRMTRRRRKRIAADRARRAEAGARPHTHSAAATQPWIDEGISRSTYYRRRAAGSSKNETSETDSRPIDRRSSIDENTPQKPPSGTTAPCGDYGSSTSTFTAEPLSSPSFRVELSRAQTRPAPVTGLDDQSFRALHREYHHVLTTFPLGPAEKARLAELDEAIETERSWRANRRSHTASLGRAGKCMWKVASHADQVRAPR
ncbi:hypothetical protein [Bradyrhizobium sp. 188]|uniref:hypothetical protein n=1 Tax=Bradyrhizobium sp. 188 TaxID=2782656 RepID=UPI001FF965B4|nr:hypothetical protein [Bradyrhizobium sp. 188]MCK1496090.1 hypothetical protein [Bradyrhizobium sp. 188]